MIKPKVGKCYYTPFGRGYRIYRYDYVGASTSTAVPVDGEPIYYNRDKARQRVYELNGWNFNKHKNETPSSR